MYSWIDTRVKIEVGGRAYGFLAVTRDVNGGDGYTITHIKSGFAMEPSNFGVGIDRDSCFEAVEMLVDNMPELDQIFSDRADGKVRDKEMAVLGKKLSKFFNEENPDV